MHILFKIIIKIAIKMDKNSARENLLCKKKKKKKKKTTMPNHSEVK